MNGDGVDEIITAPGRGRVPEIRVFTQDGVELTQFRTMAYATTFVGGVQVEAGDINGDGRHCHRSEFGAMQNQYFLQQLQFCHAHCRSHCQHTEQKVQRLLHVVWSADIAVADVGKFSSGSTLSATTPDGKSEIIVGNGAGHAFDDLMCTTSAALQRWST